MFVPLAVAAVLLAPPAAAEEEAVRVTYAAPASCPDEQVFVARVRARTQHGRFADPGELARTFDVSLTESARDQGFVGKIEFTDVDGAQARRNVAGSTCDEVTSSLALIMALSIDDRVAQTAARDNATEPSSSPAAPSTPPKKDSAAAVVAPSLPASTSSPKPFGLRWDIGVNAGALTWLTPDVAPSFGAFVELGSRRRGWSARLSGFDARETKDVAAGEGAHFATDWLRLEVCPLTVSVTSQLGVGPCVAFDGGVLSSSAQGAAIIPQPPQSLFWAAGVALLRLSWVTQERFVLGLDAELGVPFVHRDFQFRNAGGAPTHAFQIPTLGVGAKAGVGLRFP